MHVCVYVYVCVHIIIITIIIIIIALQHELANGEQVNMFVYTLHHDISD